MTRSFLRNGLSARATVLRSSRRDLCHLIIIRRHRKIAHRYTTIDTITAATSRREAWGLIVDEARNHEVGRAKLLSVSWEYEKEESP